MIITIWNPVIASPYHHDLRQLAVGSEWYSLGRLYWNAYSQQGSWWLWFYMFLHCRTTLLSIWNCSMFFASQAMEGRQLLDIIKGASAPRGDGGFLSSFPMRPVSWLILIDLGCYGHRSGCALQPHSHCADRSQIQILGRAISDPWWQLDAAGTIETARCATEDLLASRCAWCPADSKPAATVCAKGTRLKLVSQTEDWWVMNG